MQRIQRKRTKGWKKPENTICVGRPSRYSNPFKIGGNWKCLVKFLGIDILTEEVLSNWDVTLWKDYIQGNKITREDSIVAFKAIIDFIENHHPKEYQKMITDLQGKTLACWCALDKACHVDILLEVINKNSNP